VNHRQASAIIGWSGPTIRKYAAKLGIEHLDDDTLLTVWAAIEARAAEVRREADVRASDRGSESRTSEQNEAGPMIKSAESLEAVSDDRTSRSSHSSDLDYYPQDRPESEALARGILGSRIEGSINESASLTDEKSPGRLARNDLITSENRTSADRETSETRTLINARALRGIDAEIAARESELATMKRARVVLARDVERNGTAAPCGDEP